NARHPVAGRRHDEGTIEPDFARTWFDFGVPIELPAAQAQMPFADDPSRIARFAEQGRHRGLAWVNDEGRVTRQNAGAFFAPWILAGEQGVARRCASGGGSVSIGEAKSLFGEAIQVRRPHARSAVATDVAEPEIIGQNYHYIRQGLRRVGGNGVLVAGDYQAKNQELQKGLVTDLAEPTGSAGNA